MRNGFQRFPLALTSPWRSSNIRSPLDSHGQQNLLVKQALLCRLIRAGREAHPLLRLRLERNAQFKQLDNDIGELLEENLGILCISLNMLFELLVLDQGHIGR